MVVTVINQLREKRIGLFLEDKVYNLLALNKIFNKFEKNQICLYLVLNFIIIARLFRC